MRPAFALLAVLAVSATPAAAQPWTLTWSDEFDGAALDANKWGADEDCFGGGNHERQCYRAANVAVADGELRLTARLQDASGPDGPWSPPGTIVNRHYTSGKVRTATRASFRYGRIEVRARFPQGQGLWPAIWLLPEHDNYGPYPLSGEIDLAEAVNLGAPCPTCAGGRETRVHAALHHGQSLETNRQVGASTALADDGFHLFALEWTPVAMVWSVDGKPFFRRPTRPPFDQRFHLILNLAVGGRWPEGNARGIGGDAVPAVMAVDWVRVYEQLP